MSLQLDMSSLQQVHITLQHCRLVVTSQLIVTINSDITWHCRHNTSPYVVTRSRHVVTTSQLIAKASRLIATTSQHVGTTSRHNKSTYRLNNKSTIRHSKSNYYYNKSILYHSKLTSRQCLHHPQFINSKFKTTMALISLFSPMHMKSLPKLKLGQVQFDFVRKC